MIRHVEDGDRLSGHGNAEAGCPEIHIYDGRGPGGGALLCSIECFHWAEVEKEGEVTRLWIEGRAAISVEGGIVRYSDRRD